MRRLIFKKIRVMHSRILYIGLLGILLHISKIEAQNTIDLETSKNIALSYSNTIKNAHLQEASADAAEREAKSYYLPSVSAMGFGLYGFDDIIPPIPDMLPNGIDNAYVIAASASQTVYAGGKIQTSIKLAALQRAVNSIRAEQAKDTVLLLTTQKYWQLAELQEQQKVLKINEELLHKTLQKQQDFLDAGLIARNDLLKVKVQLSKLLLEKSKLENARKIAVLDFSLYLGLDYNPGLIVKDSLHPVIKPQFKLESPEILLDSSSNYQLLQKSLQAEKLQTAITKSDYLPKISVGVSASQLGSFNGSFDSNFIPLAFGGVSIPISDWWGAGKQKLKQRKIQEQIAENNFKNGTDQLRIAVLKSWYDFTDAYQQIDYAETNLDQANENLKVSIDNYDTGLADLTQVLDAQANYQDAQSELVKAFANYEQKKALYQYWIGNIDGLE